MLAEVESGGLRLAPFTADDVRRSRELIERFADLEISLADASICVVAERNGATDLLSLDERHFRVLPGPGGAPFRILPADV